MINKIPEAFPKCIHNKCIDNSDKHVFCVCDTDSGRAIIYHGDTDPCHPFLKVENPSKQTIYMLSIDECILNGSDGKKCDCAVFNDEKFCFVEIKKASHTNRNKRKKEASIQLQKTIKIFREKIEFPPLEIEAILCVGYKEPVPATSARNLEMKVQFAQSPYRVKLLNGAKITF